MPDSAYLFLELALFVYLLGFGWEELRLKDIRSRAFLLPALSLALLWLLIDQIALALGLWNFPQGGTLNSRLLALPVEEYILFFFHSLVCLVFLKHYAKVE
jgi:lycopene cyclase domain-containing protein